MAAPSSQKADARPISFILQNDATNESTTVQLVIRPEDLRRDEPALQNVTPTLAGAWLDDFGPGVTTITISGHTGWRGGMTEDGVQSFLTLRDTVWTQWHVQRAAAVSAGQSPDMVKLIYVDALDQIVNLVAPGRMVLMRNRSSPLLMRYQIPMTVLADQLSQPTLDTLGLQPDGTSTNPDQASFGMDSLANSADTLSTVAPQALLYLPGSDAPIAGLMSNGASILTAVVGSSDIVAAAALAAPLATASRNLIWSYVAAAGFSGLTALPFLQAASAFENAVCVLTNVFGADLSYTDLSSLYGASNCSSTLGTGGLSPYLGENPFLTVAAASASPFDVTLLAQNALTACANLDPALGGASTTTLVGLANTLNLGISI